MSTREGAAHLQLERMHLGCFNALYSQHAPKRAVLRKRNTVLKTPNILYDCLYVLGDLPCASVQGVFTVVPPTNAFIGIPGVSEHTNPPLTLQREKWHENHNFTYCITKQPGRWHVGYTGVSALRRKALYKAHRTAMMMTVLVLQCVLHSSFLLLSLFIHILHTLYR